MQLMLGGQYCFMVPIQPLSLKRLLSIALQTAIASIGVVVVIQVLQAKDKHQSHNDDGGVVAVVMDGESDEVELGGPIKV